MDPTSNPSSTEPSTTVLTTLTSPKSRHQQRQEASDESTRAKIDWNTNLRHGFPGPLLPLPLMNCLTALNTEEKVNWPSAREIIHCILNKHIVNEFSMSLVNRLPPSLAKAASSPVSQNQNLTCLIITQCDVHSNSWYTALKELEEQFNVGSIGGFTIEFMDPEMFKPQWPQTIGADEPIITFWPELRTEILSKLSGLEWFTLSVVRFGRRLNPLENPVTILIGAPMVSYTTWDSLTNMIQNSVDRFFLDEVEITIIPANHPFSSLDDPTELLLPISTFQSVVEMGSSFGPKAVDTSTTMGGTIRLRDPGGKTRDAFMSVFHCFGTMIDKETESQGLRPGPNSQIQTVIPSDPDRKTKLQWLDEEVQKLTEAIGIQQEKLEWTGGSRYRDVIDSRTSIIKRYQAEKNTIEEFDSSAGFLWACSGFQREHLHDWCLSLATNRSSMPNTIPPLNHVDLSVHTDYQYNPSHPEIKSRSTQSPKPGSLVWKKGRTTGITVGTINHIRSDVVLKDSQGQQLLFTGWEVLPRRPNTPFAQGGDSGAWVVDMDGNWRGVVFAELSSGSGVMQDVNSVIEDIERMTECKVELP